MACIMAPDQFSYGPVGAPTPCVEIKLVDYNSYLSTNYPKPQGEVWIRGPSVTKGYWKKDDVTKETITEDEWLQTGDIGEWNENGTLSIIDRKKNLVKLSNGEYIALEKLESIYKSCIYAMNVCVFADPLFPRPVALIVPIEEALRRLAIENDIQEKDWEKLCLHKGVTKLILNDLLEQGRQGGLKSAELLFDIHICNEEWSTDNDLLTAAQKIKRQEIVKKYQNELNQLNSAQKS
ncbi:unnamed protein product [Cunninghamella blakesleeana]